MTSLLCSRIQSLKAHTLLIARIRIVYIFTTGLIGFFRARLRNVPDNSMLQSSTNAAISSSNAPAKKDLSNLNVRRGLCDITNASRNEAAAPAAAAAANLPSKKSTSKSNTMKIKTLPNIDSITRPKSAGEHQRTKESKNVPRQITGADDIDARDSNDPRMVTCYVSDIYSHLREKEVKSVKPTYLEQQPFINAKMRAILIDWLVYEVIRLYLFAQKLPTTNLTSC